MSIPIDTIISDEFKVQGSKFKVQEPSLTDFYWREKNGVKVLVCKPLENAGFANGFSTRLGGISPLPKDALNLSGFDFDSEENIRENRKRFLQCFDKDYTLTTVWQIHSDLIKVVESKQDVSETDAKFDAIISNLDETLCGVKTADCVPVLIGDKSTKAFAAIHAGWRGTVASIVPKAINLMHEKYGTKAENLVCAIGPAAVSTYEIGQDVIDAFAENFPNSNHLFTPTRENHACVNLHKANREQLISSGVFDKNIYTAPFCTLARTDLFFSYRVDRKAFGQTGRLLSVIGKA